MSSYKKLKEIVENDYKNKDKFEEQDSYEIVLAYNLYNKDHNLIVNKSPVTLIKLDREDVLHLYFKYRFLLEEGMKQYNEELLLEENYLREVIAQSYDELEEIKRKKQKLINE